MHAANNYNYLSDESRCHRWQTWATDNNSPIDRYPNIFSMISFGKLKSKWKTLCYQFYTAVNEY